MKKIYFVLFFLCILANVSLSAQTVDNSGVRYRYNPDKFIVNGLDVDNLNIDDLDVTEVMVLTSDDGEDVRPGEVCVNVNVKNSLIISNRDKAFPVTSWEFISNDVVLQSVSVDDMEEDNMISSEDKQIDLVNEQYHVTGDVNKYYWVIYHMTKKYQRDNVDAPKFERGNEISHTLKDVNNRNISDEIFYYVEGGKYYPVTYALAGELSGSDEYEFSYKTNGCYVTYDSKNITSPISNKLDDGGAKFKLTISKDIESFCANAFVNCKFASFSVEEGNANFSTLAKNKILCRNENGVPVEVICVAYDDALDQGEDKKNVIELPASVSKISDYACKNIFENIDIRFYTPIYVEFNNNLPGNDKVHFDHPAVSCNSYYIEGDIPSYVQLSSKASTAKYLVNAEASTPEKPQVITPSETQENIINGLAGNNGICYIDLTTCEAAQSDSKTFSSIDLAKVNRNCLLFLPEGATSDATNVVCKQADGSFVCENLELSRANGVPFQTPYEFTAKNVTIVDYQIGANLTGLVLPFDYAEESVYLRTYDSFSDGYINIATATKVPAHTPFLALSKEGNAVTISATNVTIKSTSNLTYSTDASGWGMAGTYRTITNSGYNGTSLYGFSKNSLARANGATFKPFSGYFVKEANAAEAKIRTVEESETTGIFDIDNSSIVSVSGNSIIITGTQTASVSTVNGSVLFSGPINGTKVITVQPGAYVVNGIKVIVNK